MHLTREEAWKALKAGKPVLHAGKILPDVHHFPAPSPGGELGEPFALARNDDGTLTRAGMQAVLTAGGTVLHKSKHIETAKGLPSEAELARGDSAREQAALIALDQQIASLLAQKARLQGVAVDPGYVPPGRLTGEGAEEVPEAIQEPEAAATWRTDSAEEEGHRRRKR